MAVFQKKTTLVHHITYMGLTTAINIIFIVLSTYVPLLSLLLIIILPFISAVVSYYCQKRFYIIYALSSILVCSLFNLSDTLFYVFPAIVTGFFIGLLFDKKANPFWLILVSSLIESALTFALIPLINLIGNVDIVSSFLTIFNLKDFAYKNELTYLFIYFISLVQCSLTHFVMLSDAKKIGIEINTCVGSFAPFVLESELSITLALVFAFFYTPLAVTFLAISFYFATFLLINLLMSKKITIYILCGLSVIISFFVFAFVYSAIERPLGLIYVIVFPILITLISFVNYCLLKRESNI